MAGAAFPAGILAAVGLIILSFPPSSPSPAQHANHGSRRQPPTFISTAPVSPLGGRPCLGAHAKPRILRGTSLLSKGRRCMPPCLGVLAQARNSNDGDAGQPFSFDWTALSAPSTSSRAEESVEAEGDRDEGGEMELPMGQNRIDEIKKEIRDLDEVRATLEGMTGDEGVADEIEQLDSLRDELTRGLEAIEEEMNSAQEESDLGDEGDAAGEGKGVRRGVGVGIAKAHKDGGAGTRASAPGEGSGAGGEGGGGAATSVLVSTLAERGLRPDGVPPHRDSFFLALVKAVFRAGLRPQGYEFEEGEVMGSRRQFPVAAKRAKFELMRLLSSKAHKLNTIGGWRLSAAEFSRYFSKAWWSVPAARNDLFTAAAHHFSVAIECYTVTDGVVSVEAYSPPDAYPPVATIVLCRRGEHVISTVGSAAEVQRAPAKRKGGRDDIPVVEVDDALGLYEDEYGTYEGYEYDVDYFEASMGGNFGEFDGSSDDDDEVTFGWGDDRKRGRAVYGDSAPAATRRLFVVVMLDKVAKEAVYETAEQLRERFPLGSRQLDRVLRWVDKDAMHITVKSLDVPEAGIKDTVDSLERSILGVGLDAFEIRTGDIGCFWASAGSGWGRIPRVMWQGIHHNDVGPLLTLHNSLETSCDAMGLPTARRPFCAHITIAKTVRRESLNGNDRRALRVFAKWIQDPSRPMELQRALAAAIAPPREGSKRGFRRFKNWFGKYIEDERNGKTKSKRRINPRYFVSDAGEEDSEGVMWEERSERSERSDESEDEEDENTYIDVLESDRQVNLRLGERARLLVKKVCLVQAVPRTDGKKGIVYETLREVELVAEEEHAIAEQ